MSEHTASATDELVQVLIVDDNEDAASSLSMLLELEDISARTAPDAEAALQLLERLAPPLLLIDIGLPGMNGYELAQRLRQLPHVRRSTLIALTGRELQAGADTPGGTDFDQLWAKPFDPKKLLAEIKKLIAQADSPGSSG